MSCTTHVPSTQLPGQAAINSLEHGRAALTGSGDELGGVDLLEALGQQTVPEQLQGRKHSSPLIFLS